jgi:short-subunit dehydrogenase
MSRTVVITGASSGIGRATALEFARKGDFLVLASRRGDALDDVVAECEALGAQAIAVVTDVSDEQQVKTLANTAVATLGSLDVWVNNASVSAYGSLLQIPVKDIQRVLDVNILGYVYGARQALLAFQNSGRGTIINVASILGEVPQPYSAPYSMAKAAIIALGVAMRQELALEKLKKITVSTVMPATTDTPFFGHAANYSGRELQAMPPVYPPELVAKHVVRAAAKPRPEIVVGAAGKALVRQHRRHPRPVEAQMAVQTNLAQLSPTAGAATTSGNLHTPTPSSDAAVTGGWGGAKKHAVRNILAGTIAISVAAFAASRWANQEATR